jgi:hypothetical protein
MKLHTETTPDYVRFCHQAVVQQRQIVDGFKIAARKHQTGCLTSGCDICQNFTATVAAEQAILADETERLRRAKAGHSE